ncbi:hypothetical protein PWY87_31315 [Kribbella solani]|uniref:hypothetical protein n=1 Tax=Kribbella solani TaxID=236067 RepID=UPI0029A706C8|nr:hypothetical protein [Kribbella solani]MDX2974431.1 hypothetical protein [Kribbella solani]MDX3006208.1 hypothetical protein [Kribbella solani]
MSNQVQLGTAYAGGSFGGSWTSERIRDDLPGHLIAPLENRTRSALFGFDNSVISDLADWTVQLAVGGLE